MKKNILVYSVGRSDFYRYYPILKYLNNQRNIRMSIVASHLHYMELFGKTYYDFKNDFKIEKRNISKTLKDKPLLAINKFSDELNYFSNIILLRKPDIVLVLGDRFEMLAPAVASIPFNIPVTHIYGGAVTIGAVDELVRHAITKMSHLHLTAHNLYTKRIRKMGEEKWRVKTIGMPDLKILKKQKKLSINNIKKIIKLNLENKTLLITLHPTPREKTKLISQIDNLLEAIEKTKFQTIFTYPNSDLGHQMIINKIKKFCSKNTKSRLIKYSSKILYSNLLRHCAAMVGNSSSGIVEAASFKLPVINLGIRQDGKIKPKNIINTDFKTLNILNAINKGVSKKFKTSLKKLKNPYESNLSIDKICNFITRKYEKKKLLLKKFK